MTLAVVNELLAGFVKFMDSGVLIWVGLAGFAIWPVYALLVTVHEFGHAVAGLMLTSGRVFLQVGSAPGLIHGRLGRLDFSWDVRGRKGEDDGGLVLETPLVDHRAVLLFALAGPFANVFVALMLLPICTALSGIPQICAAATIAWSLYVAARNLMTRSPGSDGRVARRALRSRSAKVRAKAEAE